MNAKTLFGLAAALSLAAACGTAAGPALAKKKDAGNTYTVQKQTAPKAGKDCRKGPVPPFMRNPRFMNRGFLKKQCPS